jgi:signal transduction histidine kinase
MVVDGDPTRLRQVMWNLLSNAIKFTPARGHVVFGIRPAGQEVEIRVADDGQGIAPDFLSHVFEPFAQAEHTGGLGLGLAIVHQLVKAHGGRIEVMSDGLGAGTTFTVRLPTAVPT